MLVAYGAGNQRVQELVNGALTELKLGARGAVLDAGSGRGPGARDRLHARPDGWLARRSCPRTWSPATCGSTRARKWDPSTWPAEAEGWGFHEAPRGALGHWIRIKDRKIENYQAVVPSTWNAGPRDAKGQTGPYEASLEGTPVADPEQPLELLRTIHSFDPCLACAVHVVDAKGQERVRVEVR